MPLEAALSLSSLFFNLWSWGRDGSWVVISLLHPLFLSLNPFDDDIFAMSACLSPISSPAFGLLACKPFYIKSTYIYTRTYIDRLGGGIVWLPDLLFLLGVLRYVQRDERETIYTPLSFPLTILYVHIAYILCLSMCTYDILLYRRGC
jgi:hypothetical protein